MVKPPKAGRQVVGTKRITIHVTPEDMARQNPGLKKKADPGSAQSAPAAKSASAGAYAWFWDKISPDLAKSAPGRLELALNRIANPPGGAAGVLSPRLQTLQDIARTRGADILRATAGTEVSPALVVAMIAIESAGKADALSTAGAQGLMQLMPDTATRFGVIDAAHPGQNIKGGVAFLDHLMKTYGHDPILVLAGYNAGESAVKANAGVPPFAETRDYVPKVLAAFKAARGLCLTPPQLVSDGCVFNVKLAAATPAAVNAGSGGTLASAKRAP
nr:lytic transglycosylase domain-containing protein [Aquicoccus sp. G2-2]MEA1112530.1 lytic transglycosylase domain-containing protein [Aquicoccus sp. G2-2]